MPGTDAKLLPNLLRARSWNHLSPCRRGPPWLRVLVPIILVGGAAALRGLVFAAGENSFPFCFFYPAVVASAWVGGFFPGLFASVASVAVAKYLFISPVGSFAVASEGELVSLVLFFAVAVLLSILSEAVIRGRALNAALLERYAQSEARFRMLAANAPVGIFITDGSGAFQFVNERWSEMTGVTAEAARGKTWIEAVHDDDRERVVAEWADSARSGSEWVSEYRLAASCDRVSWVRANAVMHRNCAGQASELIGTVMCITEARRAAEERERLLAHAEQARHDAEVASRAKDEFLALLSHELRNPLAPIVTALELIRPNRRTECDKHALAIIERQVRHLGRLVDDLLDVSRITRGKVELHRDSVLLRDVIEKAIEMASPLIERRQHQLVVETPADRLYVHGDEARLAQVLSNLLTNAARYTNPGGRILVAAEGVGDEVAIRVKDNGMGIAPELLPRIFDLFMQGSAQSLDRAEGGLGLGLALVRNLVEMHGGQVVARSDGPGRGSEFIVRLPRLALRLEQPPSRILHPRPASLRTEANGRVLLIDDNVDFTEVLGPLLRELGYEITVAHDGPSALSALRQPFPEIALIDIGLPVMDGYEVGMRLRDQIGAHLRLFAMTGYGQPDDLAKSKRLGFERHLVKPVDPATLIAALAAPAPTAATVNATTVTASATAAIANATAATANATAAATANAKAS
jgi:PAS domain S-box-containing protein